MLAFVFCHTGPFLFRVFFDVLVAVFVIPWVPSSSSSLSSKVSAVGFQGSGSPFASHFKQEVAVCVVFLNDNTGVF